MARYTLLKLVQKVGESISSDEIDELDETTEATDIRSILEVTLNDLLTRRDWEFLKDRPMTAEAGNTVCSVLIPETVTRVQQLSYISTMSAEDKQLYSQITYMAPADFLAMQMRLDPSEDGVDVIDTPSTGSLRIRTDQAPHYWTTFDELEIYFDSYNSEVDAGGIDYTKCLLLATISITVDDQAGDWVAPIPERMFNTWLFEACALASVQLRQFENSKIERSARRAYVQLLEMNPRSEHDDERKPHHGRRYNH